MGAGRGDLEGALGAFLALDVAQVGQGGRGRHDRGFGPRQHLRALEMVGELDQRARRQDLDVAAGPGGFRAAGFGADQAVPALIGRHGGGKHAGDRGDRAVERELAQHREAVERIGGIAPMAAMTPSAMGRS